VGPGQSETFVFADGVELGCGGGAAIRSAHDGRAALVCDRIRREREHSQDSSRKDRAMEKSLAVHENPLGAMMRDSSRFRSGAAGNWLRRNSMKRRERGRPLVRNNPIR